MAHVRRKGNHFKGPLYGDQFAMGGVLNGLPLELAGRVETIVWFNDFLRGEADYDDTADWTESTIGAGTGATVAIDTDVHGGVLLVDGGTADDSGIQTEFTGASGAGEFLVPADNKWFAFGARFKKDDANSGAMFVGLNETLTTTDLIVATDGLLTNVTNAIGFYTGETSASLALVAKRSDGSKTTSAGIATLTDDTYVDVAVRVQVGDISDNTANGTIQSWVRSLDDSGYPRWRSTAAAFTGYVPQPGMCPAFAIKNEPVATTHRSLLRIDYFWVAIER